MNAIAPAAPSVSVSAPTLASSANEANSGPVGESSNFGTTMATADKLPPHKGGQAQPPAPAATGAALPQPGNIAPPAALLALLPGALGLPALAGGPPLPHGAAGEPAPATELKATTVSVAAASGAALQAAREAGAAGRVVQANAGAARDGAEPAAVQATGDAQNNAAAANGLPAGEVATVAASPETAALVAAAAAAADKPPALPEDGLASTPKGTGPAAANGGDGLGSTAAVLSQQSGAPGAAAAPPVPVSALQNAGTPDRHAHDSAANTAGESPVDAAAGIAAAAASVRSESATLSPASAPPAPDVNSSQFPDQIAAHVSYLVDQNLNGATLQVNPPQLGPIELRVSIEAGHAQVWLSAHSAATCDALQQSSPKLREMLTSQGFGQVSVDVSQRSFQDRSSGAQTYVWSGSAEPVPAVGAAVLQPWSPRAPTGVLDAYA